MQRIYIPDTNFSQKLCLNNNEIHHQITRVMRARVGQKYIFFNGRELQDYTYEIQDISKREVVFSLVWTQAKNSELSQKLTLMQALPNKLAKLEYIVQKCCEIGYSQLIFFESEFSDTQHISEKKIERLKKIAIEAIEQCGGNIIPHISFESEFNPQILPPESISILCHSRENHSQRLSDIHIEKYKNINIIVGPEWGFSEDEIGAFSRIKNLQKVYFGDRILRTETVGSVVGFYVSQN